MILLSVLLYETCWRTDLLRLFCKVSSSLLKLWLFVVDFFSFTAFTHIVICKGFFFFYVSNTSIQKFPYRFSIPLLLPHYFPSHTFSGIHSPCSLKTHQTKHQPEHIAHIMSWIEYLHNSSCLYFFFNHILHVFHSL